MDITDLGREIIDKVWDAGNGPTGQSTPPWHVLARYVAELEARVAELERRNG